MERSPLCDAALRAVVLALVLAIVVASSPAVAQTDVAPPQSQDEAPDPGSEHERLLAEAETLFYSAEQSAAVPVLTEVISSLMPKVASGELSPTERQLLGRALAWRAEAIFNQGDAERARQDLARLLETDPGYALDEQQVSPKILDALAELRHERVGWIDVMVSPPDATVDVDGRRLPIATGTVPILTGVHRVRVERLGYEDAEIEIYVGPQASDLVDVELQRSSAVLAITTTPAGVEVLIDDQPAGLTLGDEALAATRGELVVEGLGVGGHEILLRKASYRPRRTRIEVAELADFRLPEMQLEPERGSIVLRGLSEGASLSVNGRAIPLAADGEEIEMPPGEYHLEITNLAAARFERTIQLADGEIHEIDVELRPSVALLAVAAPSQGLVLRLRRELTGALGGIGSWTFLDRIDTGQEILARHGFIAASTRPPSTAAVDWSALLQSLGSEIHASLYLMAILRQESPGLEADYWFWSPATAPGAPLLWSPPGGERRTTLPLLETLDRPLRFETERLGMRLIDSVAAGAPVVSSIDAGGPAAAAGLRIGDAVSTMDGRPVGDRRQLLERLQRGAVELTVRRGAVPQTMRLEPQVSPLVPRPGASQAAGSLRLAVLRAKLGAGSSEVPPWLLRLNLAALLLDAEAWDDAARLLADIEAPSRAGLGQGLVDYWLGVALAMSQPGSEAARSAFTKALAVPEARLHSHDGPRIAPRAAAWLRFLDEFPPPG